MNSSQYGGPNPSNLAKRISDRGQDILPVSGRFTHLQHLGLPDASELDVGFDTSQLDVGFDPSERGNVYQGPDGAEIEALIQKELEEARVTAAKMTGSACSGLL